MKVSTIFKVFLAVAVIIVGIWFFVTEIQFQQMKSNAQKASAVRSSSEMA